MKSTFIRKPPWSAEEKAKYAELAAVGKSAKAIAEAIGRSVFAVRAHRLRIGSPHLKSWRAWTQRESDRVATMRMEGKTAAEIAVALNRTIASIRLHITSLDIARAPRFYREWLAALADGAKESIVAERMGVCIHAVKHRKRKLRDMGFDIPTVRRNGHATWRHDSPRTEPDPLGEI